MHKVDWDDYRFILAVADSGTSTVAAAKLGVNHTTVLRRITAFEKAHETKLFTRSSAGYRPTIEGEAVISIAHEMAEKLSRLRHDLLGDAVSLEGTLSVTTTDSILQGVLAPHLARFSDSNPLINIDLNVTSALLNLGRRDADVGIRPALKAPEGLIARPVATLGFAIYGRSGTSVLERGRPLAGQRWIGLGEALKGAPADQWLRGQIPASQFRVIADTFTGVRDCILAGIGIGILPCCLGDKDLDLARLSDPLRDCDTTIWILNHRDLDRSARVSAFIEQISEGIRADAEIIRG